MGKGHDARYLVSEDVGVHNVDHLLVDTGQVGTHPLHQPLLPWEQRDGAKDAAVLGSMGTGSPSGTGTGWVLRGLGLYAGPKGAKHPMDLKCPRSAGSKGS